MPAIALLCFFAVVVDLPAATTCGNCRPAVVSGEGLKGLNLLQRKSTRLQRRRACSTKGADCRSTKCCIDEALTCYEKNESWAACKNACDPSGHDNAASDRTPWSCRKLIAYSGYSVALAEERTHATEVNSSVTVGNTIRTHATGDPAHGGMFWWLIVGWILGCLIIGFASVAWCKVSHEDADADSTKAVHEKDIGESLWMEGASSQGQIDNWYRMVILNSSCHQVLSDYYFKVNATLNMTQVIFAAIAGSSVFASIGQGKITTTLGIIAGFFSMSSAVLAAIRKEMNYEQAVEQHTQAGKTFVILAMKHEELRLRSIPYIHEEIEPNAGTDKIDTEWKEWYNKLKEAIQESPFIDSTTWQNMKASQRKAKAMQPPAQPPIVLPDASS